MSSKTHVYDVGDVAELKGEFSDPDTGDPVDPDLVVCTVRKPDGTTDEPDFVSGADGIYLALESIDMSGTWWYAFDGTGGFQASGEQKFYVRAQRVPRS